MLVKAPSSSQVRFGAGGALCLLLQLPPASLPPPCHLLPACPPRSCSAFLTCLLPRPQHQTLLNIVEPQRRQANASACCCTQPPRVRASSLLTRWCAVQWTNACMRAHKRHQRPSCMCRRCVFTARAPQPGAYTAVRTYVKQLTLTLLHTKNNVQSLTEGGKGAAGNTSRQKAHRAHARATAKGTMLVLAVLGAAGATREQRQAAQRPRGHA